VDEVHGVVVREIRIFEEALLVFVENRRVKNIIE